MEDLESYDEETLPEYDDGGAVETSDEEIVLEEGEEVVEVNTADSGRVTERPEEDELTFKMLRSLRLSNGTVLEAGETYTWPADDVNDLVYNLNLRTDRLNRVVVL